MAISDYIRTIREKIGHAMLFIPAVAAVVINDSGEILLQRRSDNGQWALPGGAMDPGEEPADAVIREVFEETGVEIKPERLIYVHSGPELKVTYSNGDEAMILSLVFACKPIRGEPHVHDDESLEVRYFPADALPELPPRHQRRIEIALRGDQQTYFHTKNPSGD